MNYTKNDDSIQNEHCMELDESIKTCMFLLGVLILLFVLTIATVLVAIN